MLVALLLQRKLSNQMMGALSRVIELAVLQMEWSNIVGCGPSRSENGSCWWSREHLASG